MTACTTIKRDVLSQSNEMGMPLNSHLIVVVSTRVNINIGSTSWKECKQTVNCCQKSFKTTTLRIKGKQNVLFGVAPATEYATWAQLATVEVNKQYTSARAALANIAKAITEPCDASKASHAICARHMTTESMLEVMKNVALGPRLYGVPGLSVRCFDI